MFETIRDRVSRYSVLWSAALMAPMLALVCFALPSAAQASDARDLTVEQTSLFSIQAPAATASGQLNVVAWVDHADNTYAVGENVRLFVRASKDAYLTVLNVGPSGNTTLLFPNAFQQDARVAGGKVVEIPAPGSGAGIRVSGPVGRELIKVIASTKPVPLFAGVQPAANAPFAVLGAGARSLARDLQVTMDGQAAQAGDEWDDYNKVVTTVANRPFTASMLTPAPASTAWPAESSSLRVATDKSYYRTGEAVTIYAATATPCYLTLVNVGSSGKTRVLLPNAAQPQNFLPAGKTVVFPGAVSGLRLMPMGPAGIETVTAICTADNRPVVTADLSYGRAGFAALEAMGEAVTRDLAVVAASPARHAAHATVGFLVTQ